MSLPVLDRFTRFGLIDGEAEAEAVRDTMQSVQVHDRALFTRAGAFSGGNQQKISIGKWLLTGSRILLLYDPTRGVDVGTKHEIYVLIHEFAKAGGSVLLFSSENPGARKPLPPGAGDVQGRDRARTRRRRTRRGNHHTRRSWRDCACDAREG